MGTFQQMWNYMHTHEDVFTKSNNAGIERVKQSNGAYAFLMESSSIEYIMERDCDLAKVGGELDSKSYGIGMKKNAPFKGEINQAILKLQENGKLHMLKNKWWKQKGAKNCKVLFSFIFFSYFAFYFLTRPYEMPQKEQQHCPWQMLVGRFLFLFWEWLWQLQQLLLNFSGPLEKYLLTRM